MSNYNGYSNRETCATVLHLSNTNERLLAVTHEYLTQGLDELHGFVRYLCNQAEYDGMAKDIGDISKVNWAEVAESLNA